MSDYWFPSVDGSGRVAAGAGRVVLRQPDGTEQVWSDVHRPCFVLRGALSLVANGTGSRPAGVYQCAPDGTVAPFQTSAGPVWGANDLAVGDGWVASANAGQRAIMVWPSGAIIDDAGSPSIWGASIICIKHPWDNRRHLALNPPARGEADRPYLRLAEGDVRTPRLVEDLVAWCVGTTPWFRWPDGRIAAVGLGRAEYWPVPVRVAGVVYLMTHDDRGRLMLREPGQHMGRVIHHGVTDYPAIAATGDEDEIHVAWSAGGVLGEWRGRLRDLPMVDLRFGPPAEPPVLPTDLWDWMTPSQDGLIVADAGGQTLQTWKVGDDTLDQVKWGNPRALERWTRHDTEVRLAYDATDPKGVEAPWRLVPNRWARRHVELGAIDVYPDAVLIRRQRGTTTSERFPFAVGQRDFLPVVDLGGDLGWCAVRTLTFSPWWPSSGETEINWYAIRLSDGTRFGRVRFQLVKAGRTIADALLNRVLPGPGVHPYPPLSIPDPPQELTVGRADYPREITPAGFDMMFEDGAGRLRAEWSVRDGQRSVFALTLDGQRATRTVAHPTVIGVAPPGTPPAAGGPAYGPWVLDRPSEYTHLREAVEAKWYAGDQATRDEKLAHAITRRFEGHALAKILDEIAREGEASPPDVEPPPVDPPPPPSGDVWWTRQDIIDWRGGIAFDEELFSPFYLSWDAERRRRFRARCKALGVTHVIVMLSGEYRGRFPWFSLWGRAQTSRVLDLLGELLADRLMPVLWAANGESFTAGARRIDATDRAAGTPLNVFLVGAGDMFARRVGQPLEAMWDESLPPLAPVLGAAMPAPEMNDIWTPTQQHDRTVLLRRLLPSTYLLVHFTRARSHGDHNRGTGPAGQPPAAWNPVPDENNPGFLRVMLPDYWRATPVEGLYYNAPYHHLEDLAAFTDDLGDVSVRVNGRVPVPGKTAPYPGQGRDVVYGEGPAEWVLQGRWTWERGRALREAALTVPGITGWGD